MRRGEEEWGKGAVQYDVYSKLRRRRRWRRQAGDGYQGIPAKGTRATTQQKRCAEHR